MTTWQPINIFLYSDTKDLLHCCNYTKMRSSRRTNEHLVPRYQPGRKLQLELEALPPMTREKLVSEAKPPTIRLERQIQREEEVLKVPRLERLQTPSRPQKIRLTRPPPVKKVHKGTRTISVFDKKRVVHIGPRGGKYVQMKSKDGQMRKRYV